MYASTQDLIDRFGETEIAQASNRDMPSDGIDEAVVEQALRDASAEIDGYLSARYKLPLTHVPLVLVRVCADLARYQLYDDRAPDQVSKRHDDSVKLLQRISTGQVALGLSSEGESPEASDGAEMESGGRVWGRSDSKGFI
jgi:phage gp36-like protein